MRFHLLDRILEVNKGQSLRAVKNLTLGEEYLADHFPTFPVMPGVLMLQALVEAGAWLLRLETGQQAETATPEDARHTGLGDVELGSDVLLGAALTAQSLNGGASGERNLAWR